MAENRIKKIKLASGQTYSIFDENALRLNSDNVLVTGDVAIDEMILQRHFHIIEIDDVPVTESIANVLVQDVSETGNGEIKKRPINQLLKDIGGISYVLHDDSGTLEFKIGL